MHGADLEELLAAEAGLAIPSLSLRRALAGFVFGAELPAIPAPLDMTKEREAELIGVQPPRRALKDARRAIGIIDDLACIEEAACKELRMHIGRPALVHDLRLELRIKIIGLAPNDRQQLQLPPRQIGVLDEKAEDVAARALGDSLRLKASGFDTRALRLKIFRRVDIRLHIFARDGEASELFGAWLALGIARLWTLVGTMRIDEVIEAKAEIEEFLDAIASNQIAPAPHDGGVVRHRIDPFSDRLACDRIAALICDLEEAIIFEEIDVPVDMRHHELLVDERVALEEVRDARIIINDELVDPREAVFIALFEALIFHPKAIMRIADGEAFVGGDLAHLIIGDHLKDGLKEVEPEAVRGLDDLGLLFEEVSREATPGELRDRAHSPLLSAAFLPRKSWIEAKTASRSRSSLRMIFGSSGKSCFSSPRKRPEPYGLITWA